ncbi:MAG: ATP-binding protein [Candidatus Marinimicrobia bacterium]|nr:ATP-binding protein [Candidatus Neomarinimicrobiota bacterium]MCF7850748.1 ATP-binding protein [Candidatus Neomarinimicrobiota bacterium]MCF7905248.1 ATP-binding protein [Candidatus Neomarinimicrobiota bacterium]
MLKKAIQEKPWYLAIYVIIMALLLISSVFEYRSRYQDLLQLVQDQAVMTTGIIAQSASSQAALTDETSDFDTSIEMGLSNLLRVRGLKYIQISVDADQDPFYVSKDNLVIDDSWDRKALDDILYELKKGETHLLEVVRPIFYEMSIGEVRIGFDASAFMSLRAQMISRIFLRMGLLTVLALVGMMFLLARQNAAVLKREKGRIEQEVYRLEKINRMNEKQVAMGELAAGVAHEIRNPLNAIGIVAQRLTREFHTGDEGEEFRGLTETMSSEIEKINRSLNDFLEYTRPTPLKLTTVNLGTVFSKIHKLYQSLAEERQIEFTIASPNIQVKADIEYLQQALSNIIRNALDACDQGDQIHLGAARSGAGIEINVSDTGAGIDKRDLQRIFDLYYSTKSTGTGIGLAITHKIIADHGGTVEVDSELGKGSTFRIIFEHSL